MQTKNFILFSEMVSEIFKPIIAEVIAEENAKIIAEKTPPLDRYVDGEEAKKITKLSDVSLWKYRKSGKLVGYKIGSKLRYKFSDLMNLPQRIVISKK